MDPNGSYPQGAQPPPAPPAYYAPPVSVQPRTGDDLIAVKFARLYQSNQCLKTCAAVIPCCACCAQDTIAAQTIVVSNKITVGEFIKVAKESLGDDDGKDYSRLVCDGCELRHDDLLAPTVNAYQYFAMPLFLLQGPKGEACNLL